MFAQVWVTPLSEIRRRFATAALLQFFNQLNFPSAQVKVEISDHHRLAWTELDGLACDVRAEVFASRVLAVHLFNPDLVSHKNSQ